MPSTSADLVNVAIRWPDAEAGPWHVEGHFILRDGRPVCVGIDLWSGVEPLSGGASEARIFADTSPLSASDFRKIKPSEILQRLWAAAAELVAVKLAVVGQVVVEQREDLGDLKEWAAFRTTLDGFDFEGDGKRRRMDDRSHFEAVAAVYLHAARQGRNPTDAVQQAFHVSHSSATKWVGVARHRYGLLPKTRPGVASDPWVTTSKEAGK